MQKRTLDERLRRQKVVHRKPFITRVGDGIQDAYHNTVDGIKTAYHETVNFIQALPIRTYHTLDTLVEPAFLGAAAGYGALLAGNYVFDPERTSRPEAIGITAGSIAVGIIGSYVAHKPIGRAIARWAGKKWDHIRDVHDIATGSVVKNVALVALGALAIYSTPSEWHELKHRIVDPKKEIIASTMPERPERPEREPRIPERSQPERVQPAPEPILPEYHTDNGLPAFIKAGIYYSTNTESARRKFESHIGRYNGNIRSYTDKYFDRFLGSGTRNNGRITKDIVFGLGRWESNGFQPLLVSPMGATGLGQIMPFNAFRYKSECGVGAVFYPEYMREAVRKGDKKVYRRYAKDLEQKRDEAIKRGYSPASFHSLFDPGTNWCVTLAHLGYLARENPRDLTATLIAKYNRTPGSVDQAQEIIGSRDFNDFAHMFRDETAVHVGQVLGGAGIYGNSPDGKVQRPQVYIAMGNKFLPIR